MKASLTVIVTTRNEALNIERCLQSVYSWADQLFVIDSESTDNTVAIAQKYAEVKQLPYDDARIIPWIYQWGLEHLPIRNDWVLILEADQKVTDLLREEIIFKLSRSDELLPDGFFIKRRQIFRGQELRYGGYGNKYMLKLFRRSKGALDPVEQDTRVYITGNSVAKMKGHIEESNLKEAQIIFYLEKHLRYASAFAQEEYVRKKNKLEWKMRPCFWGSPDERILWVKSFYYKLPLGVRPVLYFFYRYFFLFGFLDGINGFLFHFFQAYWFRLVIDVRISELRRESGAIKNQG